MTLASCAVAVQISSVSSAMLPVKPSAGLLAGVSDDEIETFMASISPEQREKLVTALKMLKDAPGESSGGTVSSSYIMQCTDGAWGSYRIEVEVKRDGSGLLTEQVCTSETAPDITEKWSGRFRLEGDVLIFNGTEVEVMSDTGKVAEFKREVKAESKEFRFRKVEEGRLLHLGEDGEPLDCPYPSEEGEKKLIYPQGGEISIE